MKTIFKKTLVAVALAGLSANAFAAVNLVDGSTQVAYSTQALEAIATTFTVPGQNFVVELGAEYAVGDIVTFTFSNDALASSQLASTITTSSALAANGSPAANGAGKAAVTLGLLSTTATSATYRVTEVSTAATTVGQKFILAKLGTVAPATDPTTLALNAAKVKAGNGFKISFAAQTSNGIVIDSSASKSSIQLVLTGDQFAVAAKPVLDAIIDVNADRKKFEGGVTVDALTLTTTNKTGVDLNADGTADVLWVPVTGSVAYNKVSYVVKGDFSWIKDTDTDTPAIDFDPATLTVPVACTIGTVKVDSIAVSCTTAAAHVLTFDTAQGPETDPVIPVTSFTYDATVTHTTDKTIAYATGLTAGSWTLNGSSVFVPYMVYGTLNDVSYGQVINVANNSSKVGDIKVDAWNEDGTVLLSNVKVGEAKANTVTSIAGAVRSALNGAGLVNGKVSMKITTNVPGKAVTVYSAYVDGVTRERAIVNNDSAVQTKGAVLN